MTLLSTRTVSIAYCSPRVSAIAIMSSVDLARPALPLRCDTIDSPLVHFPAFRNLISRPSISISISVSGTSPSFSWLSVGIVTCPLDETPFRKVRAAHRLVMKYSEVHTTAPTTMPTHKVKGSCQEKSLMYAMTSNAIAATAVSAFFCAVAVWY
jgi:hypothetical protein